MVYGEKEQGHINGKLGFSNRDTQAGDTVVHSAWPLPEFASKIPMRELGSISF